MGVTTRRVVPLQAALRHNYHTGNVAMGNTTFKAVSFLLSTTGLRV